nr:MAG TPA: tRNA Pseudouridine synthase II, C terminal [Caudoviricetes sp.]
MCVGSTVDNWVYDANGNLYALGELASPWNK